jgi:predicted dehydrogenase
MLIADPYVDAVVVVTPPSLTSAICAEAIRASKPMLIEKPLALSGAFARTMAEAAESARVPLMTAQTLRFDSTIQALATAVSKAGPCRHVALTYHLEPASTGRGESVEAIGRDLLYQIGTHLFDLIRFLTHDEIVEVRCDMAFATQEAAGARAIISLRTRRNVSCLLDVARIGVQRVSRIEWIGDRMQISADWVQSRLRRIEPPSGVHEWTVLPCHTVVETIRAFVGALERRDPMPITGWDGYQAVAVADACDASATTGKPVQLAGR